MKKQEGAPTVKSRLGGLESKAQKLERWLTGVSSIALALGLTGAYLLERSCALNTAFDTLAGKQKALDENLDGTLKVTVPKVILQIAPTILRAEIVDQKLMSPTNWPGDHPAGPNHIAVSWTFKPALPAQGFSVIGTAYGKENICQIGFRVKVNDGPWDSTHININETHHIHHVLPMVLNSLPSSQHGEYTIYIEALQDSWIDNNDYFVIALVK